MGERIGKPITEGVSVPRIPYKTIPKPQPKEPERTPEKQPVKEPERVPA